MADRPRVSSSGTACSRRTILLRAGTGAGGKGSPQSPECPVVTIVPEWLRDWRPIGRSFAAPPCPSSSHGHGQALLGSRMLIGAHAHGRAGQEEFVERVPARDL